MRHTEPFDHGWQVFRGQIDVPRNTAKTATAGGPSDLTLAEGTVHHVPDRVLAALGDDVVTQWFGTVTRLDEGWESVSLPDDWTTRVDAERPTSCDRFPRLGDPDVGRGYLPSGIAWYRKRFAIPASLDGWRVYLDFDGVMRDARVWVNGSFIAAHYSGYTGFEVDVTEFLRYGDEGDNVVLVRTDTRSSEGWWAEGGGIYRHVRLLATDPVRVARHGVFVRTRAVDGAVASIDVDLEIENNGSTPRIIEVDHAVGEVDVAHAGPIEIGGFGRATVTARFELVGPALWSPDHPNLYRLTTLLRGVEAATDAVDAVDTTFGVRTVRYGPDGLELNGELVTLRGVCCHQDFGAVGVALPDRVHRHKIELLKALGVNAYRCAHHPPAPEILDACDRLGVLVLDENRRLESNGDGLADLAELIRRDRNHPSVFMWCLENEELVALEPVGTRLLRRLVDVAHHLDPTRSTTIAGQWAKGDAEYMGIADVAGFNYDSGDASRFRDARPGIPVMATEDVSFVSTRGVYEDVPAAGLCSSHDEGPFLHRMIRAQNASLEAGTAGGALSSFGWLEASSEARARTPWLGGTFVWTGFDYRGESVPFGWPAVSSSFGMMDACGFPKDVAHYWRSRWTAEPVVHLFPHWNWPAQKGTPIRVGVYTNCERVELSLNDALVAALDIGSSGILDTEVVYEPGVLTATGFRDGVVVATARRETTGPAAGLRLRPRNVTCRAGGADCVVLEIDIVDPHGRVVPTAGHDVAVIAGNGATVVGTASGNPADGYRAAAARRAAFNGHALAIVRGPKDPGAFRVEVTGSGLTPAAVSLEAVRAT